MKKTIFTLLLAFMAFLSANATTWYVDSTATGSKNGTSWANAWTSLSAVTGVKGGDTVYISGGPTGGSQTYSLGSGWTPVGGSGTSVVTYQIGQDSSHNGSAIFSGTGTLINGTVNNFALVGDAGNGQQHFKTSGFSTIEWTSNSGLQSNVRIAYVNFGSMAGSGPNGNVMAANPVQNWEFDHNYVFLSSPTANALGQIVSHGTTWDDSKFHHNQIFLPHASGDGNAGIGADGIESGGCIGMSIYNNTFTAYTTNYTGGQHQDGWQDTGGSSYIKIYNNTWINIGNYAVYGDATFGSFSHLWVYDNVSIISDSSVTAGSPGAFVVGVDGGFSGTANFTDVAFINNITDGYLNNQGISLNNVSSHGASFVNCLIANNVSVNGGGISTQGNSSTPLIDNISLTTSQASLEFTEYIAQGTSNDYHLTARATDLIGKGANEYSYFTTDFQGDLRPSSGPWDLGIYIENSSNSPPPPPPPTPVAPIIYFTYNLTNVTAGSTVTFTPYVTTQNGDSYSWMWSNAVSNIATALSRGTNNITPLVYTFPTNSGGQTYQIYCYVTDLVNGLSNGSNLTVNVGTNPVIITPSTNLILQASSATITSPFVLTSGYVYQPVQYTTTTGSGKAIFNFNITSPGNYYLIGDINAPNDGANSFFINIDSSPTSPSNIWDTILTSGFQEEPVSWRGNGNDASQQFPTNIWNLSAGAHQIILIGREANTELQYIKVVPVSTNIVITPIPVLPPTGVKLIQNTPTFSAGTGPQTITLNWTAPAPTSSYASPSGYYIIWNNTNAINVGNNTSVIITGLPSGTANTVVVESYTTNSVSVPSSTVAF